MSGPRPMKIWRITGSLARTFGIPRHVAPAENDLTLGAYRTLNFFLTGKPGCRLFRQEDHADTIISDGRQAHALLGHLLAKERVGKLNQNPGAVAHQRIGTDRAAVIQVVQDQQPLLDDRVTLLAPDMRYKTDATGVVLVGGVVEPLPFRYGRIDHARILTRQRCMVPGRALRRTHNKNRHEAGQQAAPGDPRLYP